MGDISDNFSYSEFLVSGSFKELLEGIEFTEYERFKCFMLVKTQLQPARDYIKRPIILTSGFRTPELVKALRAKGYQASLTSDHLFGGFSAAVDFKCYDPHYSEGIYNFFRRNIPHSFGQLICYRDTLRKITHIHTSLPTEKHHAEVWESIKGKRLQRIDQ